MLEGREWFSVAPASPQTLGELKKVSPVALPESYYCLLAFSDGGEGPLPVSPHNICLDSAAAVIEAIRTENYGRSDLAKFVIFGGNGGGEFLAFDIRHSSPWPIVFIDMVAGPASAELVAPSFDMFVDLIGRASEDS